MQNYERYASNEAVDPAVLAEHEKQMREARVEWLYYDVERFGRYYFPEYFEDETPTFHHELNTVIDEFERNHDGSAGLILAAPRGHGKSFRISFLKVIHWICYQQKRFIVLISDTGTQAESLTSNIRMEFDQNDRLREDFGDLVGETYGMRWTAGDFSVTFPKRDANDNVVLNSKGKPRPGYTCRVVARGTGAGMRGLRSRAARPDAIIIDDGENDEMVQTPLQREKVWSWLTGAVVPMLHPRDGILIVVGTVLHFDSMLSRLLKQDDIYRVKRYRAMLDNGESLWPARYPKERLDRLKKQIGTLKFNQEYMNDPIDDQTQIFRPEWFRWYTKHDVDFDNDGNVFFRGQRLLVLQAIDPAIAEDEQNDYFARGTIGVTDDFKIIVLRMERYRIDFPTQVKYVIDGYDEWLPDTLGIEENGYQRALRQQVEIKGKIRIKKLKHVGVTKYTRIVRVSPLVENGLVYLREALPGEAGRADPYGRIPQRIHENVIEFFEEMTQYPRSPHDDQADVFSMDVELIDRGRFLDDWSKQAAFREPGQWVPGGAADGVGG